MLSTWRAGGRWLGAKATAVVTFSCPVGSVSLCCSSVSKEWRDFWSMCQQTQRHIVQVWLMLFLFRFFFFFFFTLGPKSLVYFHQVEVSVPTKIALLFQTSKVSDRPFDSVV